MLYLKFSFGIFCVKTNDSMIEETLRQIYDTDTGKENSGQDPFGTVRIFRTDKDNVNQYTDERRYCVIQEDGSQLKIKCMEDVIGVLLAQIEKGFFRELNAERYLIHAAGVCCQDTGVAFVGSSGSGKTTAALLFAQLGLGEFLGDEYAFFDVKNGQMWFECGPVQLKSGNQYLEQMKRMYSHFTYRREDQKEVICFCGKEFIKRKRPVPLKIMVFPHYDAAVTDTEIRKFSVGQLPEAILQSVKGAQPPVKVLREFLRFAAENNVIFLEVFFSDGKDMAKKLRTFIEEQGLLVK